MLLNAMMLVTSLALPAPLPSPAVLPAPVTIHQMHEQPLDIALAWHTPADGSSALAPPLDIVTYAWSDASNYHTGTAGMGDRIIMGTLSNSGEHAIHVVDADGGIITLAAGENLWVGPPRSLDPTHQCACRCECAGGNKSTRFVVPCDSTGGCSMEGSECELPSDDYLEPTGVVRTCRRIWVWLPPQPQDG
ncbi:MAG: hypothetical protein QF733_08865 [Phycisphaerales bacterium]|jgi:hypothetical protein|nr:hypothetical protein [Phycisphaerales bacterium]